MAADVPLYDPGPYVLVRLLVKTGLAVTYLLAFLAAARQFRPLAGEAGLSPLGDRLERVSFRERPTLFHWAPTDRAAGVAAWTGLGLSVVALLGLPAVLPRPFGTAASVLVWLGLWALYLSFVNAGGVFYGYGWESMLLETGLLAAFLGPADVAPPAVVVWLLRWVLFRNMVGAGLIKLRGDDCWRDLSCLEYHYETQPMPNALSWYAHHLPEPVHRAGVLVNHVVELSVPLLYFAPQPLAAVAGGVTILFQAWLMTTGNFSWLNFLTIVQAFAAFSDRTILAGLEAVGLGGVLPGAAGIGSGGASTAGTAAGAVAQTPPALAALAWVLAAAVAVLSVRPVLNMVSSNQAMNASFDPLHLVNTYGAFGSITRVRHELVIQGTRARDPDADDWATYAVPGKPTDPARRPPQVAPYHLRLGWQLWFAAMSSPRRNPWLLHLLAKLLAADEGALSLLRTDPFDGEPPARVRVLRYRYRFTTPAERSATGRWWHRERAGTYVGPVSLDDPRFRRQLDRRGWLEGLSGPGPDATSVATGRGRSERDGRSGTGTRRPD